MANNLKIFLNGLLQKCKGKHYLFRGTPEEHSKKGEKKIREKQINSSLYRWAIGQKVVFHEKFSPFNIEKEIVEKAKKHFADSASNIEILTELQHYSGKTNLIDFSRNLYTGLFFACNGSLDKDGELILLDLGTTSEKRDVNYEDLQSSSLPFTIEPANTQTSQRRVISQGSIFVYAPKGYIDKNRCEIVPIPMHLKQPILAHLQEIHNIHADTIYNDLIGFIANEKNYETVAILFYKGFALDNEGKHEKAIAYYDKAIELSPSFVETYNNRGIAKGRLKQYEEAITDFDKAIELNPGYAKAYYNRGLAKARLNQDKEAIADYDKAVELNPSYAEAYNNRGVTKARLQQYEEAIADYDKAIELNPGLAEAYLNRGEAKDRLKQHEEAAKDFQTAQRLKAEQQTVEVKN